MSSVPTASSATAPATAAPAAGRPLTADDLYDIKVISDPHLSPDGTTVAYVVTQPNRDDDAYRAALWLAPVDPANGAPRQLTSGAARDTSPRWSPDGRTLAFVSNRPGAGPAKGDGDDEQGKNKNRKTKKDTAKDEPKKVNQIWLIEPAGGEARQLTTRARGASGPVWSPDGATLAFTAATNDEEDAKTQGTDYTSPALADERVLTDISYRFDGIGFIETHSHVWTVPATGGDAKQLTFGPYSFSEPAWSPDGSRIVFAGNRQPDRSINRRALIYGIPATGGEPHSLLGEGTDYAFGSPVFSPDGSRIAVVGNDRPGTAENDTIWTIPAGGGTPTNHTAGFDRSFGDHGMGDLFMECDVKPVWTNDGQAVLMLASDQGATHVFRAELGDGAGTGGTVTPVTTGNRRIAAFAPVGDSDDRMLVLSGEPHRPFELLVTGGKDVLLTHHNDAFLDEVSLSPAEEIRFQSAAGDREIQGWILTPAAVKPGSGVKHPAIVEIHGGPHGMYGWAMFHEMQLMVARGYIVLYTNPRGSSGYGQDFTITTRGRWGESDMPDIMGGLDALLARGDVDPARVGVTGGSYGGYLTNWIVGHTDRFRAAVTQRCVSNFYSFYGTSDIGWTFGDHEFGGTPWGDTEKLLKHSPITYVNDIHTPLLILHSERDFRCPIEQGEQMFTALKKLGRETEFVRFPEESHGLSRNGTPSRRLARLHHLIGWFDRHL